MIRPKVNVQIHVALLVVIRRCVGITSEPLYSIKHCLFWEWTAYNSGLLISHILSFV